MRVSLTFLVFLFGSPALAQPADLVLRGDTKALMTVVGGKVVYRNGL